MTLDSITSSYSDIPEDVRNFAHVPGGRVEFGSGIIDRLGEFCQEQEGVSHVFLVSDPGIAEAGHIERAVAAVESAGLRATVFDDVHPNPTTDDVARGVAAAKDAGIDVIVGLGGGSSMDTAKGCNFLLTNGGEMKDYWGVGKAEKPMLPFIAVPTTAGTGSECQSFALIADIDSHMKMACGDKKSAATIALLDPELTLTKPARVTAVTGIDAIAHAVETAVCNKRTEVSTDYSRLAFSLLDGAFPRVLAEPTDLGARSQMLAGAAYAGTAIENSMLGIAHSLANPLTAEFDVVHGDAVGVMLPHVIRFNAKDRSARLAYSKLFPDGAPALADRISHLLALAKIRTHLTDHGVGEGDLARLAGAAADQWTAQFNPREADAAALEGIYRSAL